MLDALNTCARLVSGGAAGALDLDWSALRYPHVSALRSALAERYAPATVNKCLAAVRRVAEEAYNLEQITAEDLQRIRTVKPLRSVRLPRGRALATHELASLSAACNADRSPAGRRDDALIAVLYAAGLRRQEAAALDVSDWDPTTHALTVRAGKGNKDRLVPISGAAVEALADWMRLRGSEPGPLFLPIDKGGSMRLRRMDPSSIYRAIAKRGAEAGLAHFSPHDLRRTMISDALDASGDISVVQQLAGHSSPTTTAHYDMRGERAKERVASMLHYPRSL